MNKFSDLDGEIVLNYEVLSASNPIQGDVPRSNPKVVNYDVVSASNPVTKNYFDQDDFYPADGSEFHNAIGNKKARASRRAERRKRGFLGLKDRAKRKQTEADAQLAAAQSLSKDSKADIELAKSIGKIGGGTKGASKKGLSTMAWVGIGAGVLAILGVTIYLIKRKK